MDAHFYCYSFHQVKAVACLPIMTPLAPPHSYEIPISLAKAVRSLTGQRHSHITQAGQCESLPGTFIDKGKSRRNTELSLSSKVTTLGLFTIILLWIISLYHLKKNHMVFHVKTKMTQSRDGGKNRKKEKD